MAPSNSPIQPFIDRWRASGAAERANYQLFLTELCDVIGVAHPRPATDSPHENAYVFEKPVPSPHGTTNFMDLYKRNCFVLEAKQGADKQSDDGEVFSEAALRRLKQRKSGTATRGTKGWDTAMEKAHKQAQTYARSLPAEEIRDGRPPFILVVDVGDTLALYSEFSRTGAPSAWRRSRARSTGVRGVGSPGKFWRCWRRWGRGREVRGAECLTQERRSSVRVGRLNSSARTPFLTVRIGFCAHLKRN